MNITYIDALGEPGKAEDPLLGARFLATQSIQFALPGVPATYLPSMLGSRNWQEGVEQSGQPRRINRQPLDCEQVVRELADGHSFRCKVFQAYRRMASVRRRQPAFGPGVAADVLDLGPSVFAIRRRTAFQTLWALTNISARRQTVRLDQAPRGLVDLMDAAHLSRDQISLGPYQSRWLSDQTDAAQP